MENDQNEIESFKNETIIIVKVPDGTTQKRRLSQTSASEANASHGSE
jgi:hypothetical protein